MKDNNKIFKGIQALIALIIIEYLLMDCWNSSVASLTHLPQINFTQALNFTLLVGVLIVGIKKLIIRKK